MLWLIYTRCVFVFFRMFLWLHSVVWHRLLPQRRLPDSWLPHSLPCRHPAAKRKHSSSSSSSSTWDWAHELHCYHSNRCSLTGLIDLNKSASWCSCLQGVPPEPMSQIRRLLFFLLDSEKIKSHRAASRSQRDPSSHWTLLDWSLLPGRQNSGRQKLNFRSFLNSSLFKTHFQVGWSFVSDIRNKSLPVSEFSGFLTLWPLICSQRQCELTDWESDVSF